MKTNDKIVEYSYFQPTKIPSRFVKALAELTLECEARGITFETRFYQGGFQCHHFSCHPQSGDVVIHDHSYGQYDGKWESYNFPWDDDDVSVMTTVEFVDALWHEYMEW